MQQAQSNPSPSTSSNQLQPGRSRGARRRAAANAPSPQLLNVARPTRTSFVNQALLNALQAPPIRDTHSGTWQKEITPFLNNLTQDSDYVAAGQAYLNPGHQSNAMDAVPLPDGTPGRSYLFRSVWNEEVNLVNQPNVTFYNLPFFEAPFGMFDASSGKLRTFYSPNALTALGPNPANFCAAHGVYMYRCLGKSMTIVNTTAVVNLRGSVTVARKTPDVDYTNRTFAVGISTDPQNQPILQNLPYTLTDVSSLQGTTDTWNATEGAYLISHHSDHGWVTRDDFTHKAFPNGTFANNLANTALLVKPGTGAVAAVDCYGSPGTYVNVGPQDHTDIPMACFNGLSIGSTTSFSVKCVMVYEMVLKLTSDLLIHTVERPLMAPHFIDALFAYESKICVGGMKADANSWGDVWKGFKKFWGNGGSAVTRAGLNAILPGAGTVGSMLGDFSTKQW